jgi:hypothetical protein
MTHKQESAAITGDRFKLAPQDGQGYVFRDHLYSMGSDGGRRHDAAIA